MIMNDQSKKKKAKSLKKGLRQLKSVQSAQKLVWVAKDQETVVD